MNNKKFAGLNMYAVETRAGLLENTISRSAAEAIDKTVGNVCRKASETNDDIFNRMSERYGWKVVMLATTYKNLGPA